MGVTDDPSRISARLYRTDGSPANEASTTYKDESGFMAAIDRLASGLVAGLLTDPDQDLSALAAGTTDSFEALRHYLEAEKLTRAGDHERAREEVDAALALDSTFALAWYLGEIMELQGNRRAAIEQFSSVVGKTRFAAPGWERAAGLYEELGESDEAIRYYGLMIDMWENADPRLQPRVEAARARRDGLLDDLTREPETGVAQQE